MTTACPDSIPPLDPDIAGIGVRISIYAQAAFAMISSSTLLSLPSTTSSEDIMVAICQRSRTASWVLAFSTGAMILTAYIKMWKHNFDSYHALILGYYSIILCVVQGNLILAARVYDSRGLRSPRNTDILVPSIMILSQVLAGVGLVPSEKIPPDATCIPVQTLRIGTPAFTAVLAYFSITIILALIPAAVTYPISVVNSWKCIRWLQTLLVRITLSTLYLMTRRKEVQKKGDVRLAAVGLHISAFIVFSSMVRTVEKCIAENPIRPGETVWGFGQIVSIMVLILPARDTQQDLMESYRLWRTRHLSELPHSSEFVPLSGAQQYRLAYFLIVAIYFSRFFGH